MLIARLYIFYLTGSYLNPITEHFISSRCLLSYVNDWCVPVCLNSVTISSVIITSFPILHSGKMSAGILDSPGLITSPEVLWQRGTVKSRHTKLCICQRTLLHELWCGKKSDLGKIRQQPHLDLSTKSTLKQCLFVNLTKDSSHAGQTLDHRAKSLALSNLYPRVL